MRTLRISMVCAALALSARGATLTHLYTFTGNANDAVGTAHGALNGNASVAGGVLNLDGDGDFVQYAAKLIPGLGNFSLALDARLFGGPPTGYMEMISQGASGSGFYIGTAPGGGMRVSDVTWPGAMVFPSAGVWHTFVLTVDGANSKLYIDGSLYNTLSGSVYRGQIGEDTRLGRQFGSYSEYFNGQIDNVRLWDGALTAGEVAALNGGGSEMPEPWSVALTGAGLGAVALRRRMRAKHHHAG